VTWSLSPNTGTINSAGSYTAPATIASLQTVTVTATSVADATKSASATVTLTPLPTITGLSTSSATAGAQIIASGSGFGSAQGTGFVWLGSTPGTVVTWSNTQITATVASNAVSGSVYVRQWGLLSNAMLFTVSTATITSVSPSSAAPSAQVTITGSGFGASEGTGHVWLGGAIAAVQNWNDSQIVVQVPQPIPGAAGSGAQVLQNGVMSQSWPFTVDALQLSGIAVTPNSSPVKVTFTGTGFGSAAGVAWLGDKAANVVSWSDAQVVATLAPLANSGVAKIQQNGVWSNSKLFSVPGSSNTVVPSILNMVVGDSTQSLHALTAASQPVTGLTWTSSNPAVVSLSTDDPPVLTALAAGNVTITAGTGTADVTVWAGSLPLGTVIWSNPGNGSGVTSIVPAVPSSSGVADVFAFQNDGTVAAITSDGTTAWTASSANQVLPDFQGGLAMANYDEDTSTWSIWKVDGITGQSYPSYSVAQYGSPGSGSLATMAVHTDGTIFAAFCGLVCEWINASVVGIDPSTGTSKFNIPLCDGALNGWANKMIVAGDGYAYVPYNCYDPVYYQTGSGNPTISLWLLRVNSSGVYDKIYIADWENAFSPEWTWEGSTVALITNADQGVLMTWELNYQQHSNAVVAPRERRGGAGLAAQFYSDLPPLLGMATTAGTNVSYGTAPQVPGSRIVTPVLQAQDGSFVGSDGSDMVAFDASGTVRWVVPNMCPQIATADGGVIAQAASADSGCSNLSGPGYTFDANGNATGMMDLLTQSWTGYSYQDGPVEQVVALQYLLAAGFWEQAGGQFSPGVASLQVDSDTDSKVKDPNNGILNSKFWNAFANSKPPQGYQNTCHAVFGSSSNPLFILRSGISNPKFPKYDPTMQNLQKMLRLLRFYNAADPAVARYQVWQTLTRNPGISDALRGMALPKYLTTVHSIAATLDLGNPGPILLGPDVLTSDALTLKATLVHEVFLHGYAGWADPQIMSNPATSQYFIQNGLPANSNGSTAISDWMVTDCNCSRSGGCPAVASWVK